MLIKYLVFLPPANEVCEGYVFTCVCLSTGGVPASGEGVCSGGGVSASPMTATAAGGMHPTGMHSCVF